MIADDERRSHGRGQGGWRFRANGDVEIHRRRFADRALDLRYLFTLFLSSIAVGKGREGRGEVGDGGPEELESVISESTLAAATTDHTHRRVAKREKQKDSERRKEIERERQTARKNRNAKERGEEMM